MSYSLLSLKLKPLERQYCGVCTPPDTRDKSQARKRHGLVIGHELKDWGWWVVWIESIYVGSYAPPRLTHILIITELRDNNTTSSGSGDNDIIAETTCEEHACTPDTKESEESGVMNTCGGSMDDDWVPIRPEEFSALVEGLF
jgi:hypothetical protein